jgi:hypothetical protein
MHVLQDAPKIVQALQDCSTYIMKLSRKALMMLAAPVHTSCDFTALYCSMMATKILQTSHRHLPIPQPCDACDFQKLFNSELEGLLSQQQQQLLQLPPCWLR